MGEERAQHESQRRAEQEAEDRLAEGVDARVSQDAQQQQFAIAPRRLGKCLGDHLQMRQIEVVEYLEIQQDQAAWLVEKALFGEVAGDSRDLAVEDLAHAGCLCRIVCAQCDAQPARESRT